MGARLGRQGSFLPVIASSRGTGTVVAEKLGFILMLICYIQLSLKPRRRYTTDTVQSWKRVRGERETIYTTDESGWTEKIGERDRIYAESQAMIHFTCSGIPQDHTALSPLPFTARSVRLE